MSRPTSERAAYVALALTPGIGTARLRALLAACSTPLGAFSAPFAFLCAVPGMSKASATAVCGQTGEAGERVLVQTERLGGEVLIPDDSRFPNALREIPDAPPILFAHGRPDLLDRPAVAVVGSRDHTAYGADVCALVAGGAAAAGIVVVSGMARGLDALAHDAALSAGGTTIGVLGNGLGVVYPVANRRLYDRVAREGLLLTEFPPGERPNAGSFPRRNRLISGLSRVTVVVEAAPGSGALITAAAALEQGRDVMAVPGPITSNVSGGANALIRDGAEPLLGLEDLLDHYPEAVAGAEPLAADPRPLRRPLPPDLPDRLRSIAECVGDAAVHVDAVATVSKRPIAEVLSSLCELELLGIVEQHAGRMFTLTNESQPSGRTP